MLAVLVFAATISMVSLPSPDLNGDGIVDVGDMLILFDAWGVCDDCENCPADLNGDCSVDVSDLLILFDHWGPVDDDGDEPGGENRGGGMTLDLASETDGIDFDPIELPEQPLWLTDGPFTIAGWIRPTSTELRTAFAIEGLAYIALSETSSVFRLVQIQSDAVEYIEVADGGGHAKDEWRLVMASWNPSTGEARCYTVSASVPDGTGGTIVAPGFSPGIDSSDPPFGLFRIGTGLEAPFHGEPEGAIPGIVGQISVISVRRGVEATLDDAVAMYQQRRPHAPMAYTSDSFSGLDDDMIAFNHAIRGSTNAAMEKPITNNNYCVYYRRDGLSGQPTVSNALLIRRDVSVSGSLIYTDYRDIDSTFFTETKAEFSPSYKQLEDGVRGNSDVLARIARNMEPANGVYRVLVVSNSRGMRRFGTTPAPSRPYHEEWHANHAHGYMAAQMSENPVRLGGILRAHLYTTGFGGTSNLRQFMFNAVGGPFTSGTVVNLGSGWNDFRRFWTGSGVGSFGPGDGVRMMGNSQYCFKALHMPGTLATKDRELRFKISYLRFPGSLDSFNWENREAASQSSIGAPAGPSGTVSGIDSREADHVFDDVADAYVASARTLTIENPDWHVAQPGWAIYIGAETGTGSIAEIEDVVIDDDRIIITLRHPFENSPAHASLLHLGPWEFASVEYTAPPSMMDYRDPLILTGDEADPLILLSYSAWALGEPVYVFGPAGWGGSGFRPQLDEGVKDLYGKIAVHFELDAVLLHGAYQSTEPEDMKLFADSIVEMSPLTEVIMCSDMLHHLSDGDTSAFADYAVNGDHDYAGSVATRLHGSFLDQILRAGKYDRAHPELVDMLRLAQEHLELWRTYFEPTTEDDEK
jgi:hypothetical protein